MNAMLLGFFANFNDLCFFDNLFLLLLPYYLTQNSFHYSITFSNELQAKYTTVSKISIFAFLINTFMSKETLVIRDVINNVKDIYMSDSSLTTLLDFERVLDSLDLYAYRNWQLGELIQGPIIEKYFVSCKFMWPLLKMPDPCGGARLLQYDCEVNYQKTGLKYPKQLKSYDDYEPGTKVAEMEVVKIWIVEIIMPKSLMNDIHQGSLEKESDEVDLDDLEDAYEQGLDDEVNSADDNEATLATQDEEAVDEI